MNRIEKANVTHLWSVLCQSATIDGATNDLSLFKVIDELAVSFPKTEALQAFSIRAAEKPVAAPLACELVTLWKKLDRSMPADFDSRITYRDPEGKALQVMEIPIKMEDGKFRHRSRLTVSEIPMTMPGEYHFVVEAKGKNEKEYELIAEIPLDITFRLEKPKAKE